MTSPLPDPAPQSDVAPTASVGKQLRNLLVVLSAIALTVVLFVGMRQHTQTPSLTALAAESTPLETAVSNGKPTVMEFYANWCSSCQAMAADVAALKRQYDRQVNFVMLNVDNNKWLPEVLRFQVDGIPHFVFVDAAGTVMANAIGQQPRQVMAAALSDLVNEQPLSLQQVQGQTSVFEAAIQGQDDDPRSHGGQPSR